MNCRNLSCLSGFKILLLVFKFSYSGVVEGAKIWRGDARNCVCSDIILFEGDSNKFCFYSYQSLGDLGLLALRPSDSATPDYIWQMTPLALGATTLDDYCGFRQKMR